MKPKGQKKILGKGSHPLLYANNNKHVIWVSENEKQIHALVESPFFSANRLT
jgi:hypothetical protein